MWGVATAAYQIEGAWNIDGKGPSVWDTLAHRGPGFAGGATGDVACDHYHLYETDLDLLSRLGATSYRFSVSWPRVQPAGRGEWNREGIEFYERLVDGLLDRDIQPALTLYHWDHPQALEDLGGWMNRDTAYFFADFAGGMADRLGDRVTRWITLNEPLSVLTGNVLGFNRPAGPLGESGMQVAHHLLLGHGLAVRELRDRGINKEIGITVDVHGFDVASDHPADIEAAHRAEILEDRLFLDPLLLGHYPELDGNPVLSGDTADMNIITTPIDFIGVNWYAPARVGHPWLQYDEQASAGAPSVMERMLSGHADLFGYARRPYGSDVATSAMGWPVLPERLGAVLHWLRTNYPTLPTTYITENGLPGTDEPNRDGRICDESRIDYLDRCLQQVVDAVETGMDIRGYYVWSLMDNLEWGLGYGPRFGLVHVDFDTLVRTPKDSYYWYRDLISAHKSSRAPNEVAAS